MELLTRQPTMRRAKPLVVTNVVGAGGTIGLERLSKAPGDGYTLGVAANSLLAIAPHLGPLPYDTVKSFAPIGILGAFPYAVVVNANSPITNMADLIARAKAKPGTVSAANPGVGTGTHLANVLLAQRAGVRFNDIQYKGAAPILNDIMGGHVDFTLESMGSAMPGISGGKLKAIATTGTKRHPLLPSVPTVWEDVPGFEFTGWFAMFGPSSLPPEVTRKLNAELAKIQASEEYKSWLESRGYQVVPGSSSDLAAGIRSELVKWGEVVKAIPAGALAK